MSAEGVSIVLASIEAMMREMPDDDRDEVANEFLRRYANELSFPDAPDLTPEEWRVLRDAESGKTTAVIAARMGLSTKSVYAIKARVKAKLGTPNFLSAITEAYKRGML